MLVLTRKNNESVIIGGSERFERILKVTVLEINSRSVRLGFEADGDVPIHRHEVWEKICAGNTALAPAVTPEPIVLDTPSTDLPIQAATP